MWYKKKNHLIYMYIHIYLKHIKNQTPHFSASICWWKRDFQYTVKSPSYQYESTGVTKIFISVAKRIIINRAHIAEKETVCVTIYWICVHEYCTHSACIYVYKVEKLFCMENLLIYILYYISIVHIQYICVYPYTQHTEYTQLSSIIYEKIRL